MRIGRLIANALIVFASTTAAKAGGGGLCDAREFWSPLSKTDAQSQFALVKAELESRAEISCPSERDSSLTSAILFGGNPEVVRLLLDCGADASFQWEESQANLIHIAMYASPIQMEVIELLHGAGVPIDAVTTDGDMAIHLAAGRLARDPMPEFFDYFVAHGIDVNAVAGHGNTPLHYAAGNVFIGGHNVEALLDVGAYPCVRNDQGQLPVDLIPAETDWILPDIGREGFFKLIEVSTICETS